MAQTKYIFVTGGVTSSLGKGMYHALCAKLLAKHHLVFVDKRHLI
jgi:CTP synthase (UTP-ammonia lyase)